VRLSPTPTVVVVLSIIVVAATVVAVPVGAEASTPTGFVQAAVAAPVRI
jgi:hypothetical protein